VLASLSSCPLGKVLSGAPIVIPRPTLIGLIKVNTKVSFFNARQ
jgi:hypothetical protein